MRTFHRGLKSTGDNMMKTLNNHFPKNMTYKIVDLTIL
jgi:hypothetical protein